MPFFHVGIFEYVTVTILVCAESCKADRCYWHTLCWAILGSVLLTQNSYLKKSLKAWSRIYCPFCSLWCLPENLSFIFFFFFLRTTLQHFLFILFVLYPSSLWVECHFGILLPLVLFLFLPIIYILFYTC